MKIRSGFVSNSSSSSFVVAIDKSSYAKIKITIDVNLKDFTTETIKTIKKLDEYYLETWAYGASDTIKGWLAEAENDSWAVEQYKVAKKAIERGKTVLIGRFCDEDGDPVESMLCYKGLKGIVGDDIEIIESGGGY